MKRLSAGQRTLLRWLLALLLLGLSVRWLVVNPEPLQRLLSIGADQLLALAALVVLNQALMSWRFALAMKYCADASLPGMTWFRLTVVGQFLNLFVPQLGNVYRGVVLKRDHGIPYIAYASGLLAFIWLDLLTGLALAGVVVAIFEPGMVFAGLPTPLWLGATISALVAGPFVFRSVARRLAPRAGPANRLQARLTMLLSTLARVLPLRGFLLRFGATNILASAGQVAALWVSFDAVGANVNLPALILFQVFLKLSNLVVITPGNLGLTELAYGVLAHASQCTPEQGIAVSFLVRAVWMVVSITLGLLFGGGRLLGSQRAEVESARESEGPSP